MWEFFCNFYQTKIPQFTATIKQRSGGPQSSGADGGPGRAPRGPSMAVADPDKMG
jgi:hypothetical protein